MSLLLLFGVLVTVLGAFFFFSFFMALMVAVEDFKAHCSDRERIGRFSSFLPVTSVGKSKNHFHRF